jgi:hypothetical protein
VSSNSRVARTVVPRTIEGVAGLLVARKWDKAAIVYAWTTPEESGGRPQKRVEKSTLYNIKQFAALGITGLTDPDSVRAYRNNWVWAIEQGLADPVGPGDEINLDLLFEQPFPPTTVTYSRPHEYDAQYEAEAADAGISKDAVRRTAANKAALKAAIKADPEVARAAREAVIEAARASGDKVRMHREVQAIARGEKPPTPKPPLPRIPHPVEEEFEGLQEEVNRRVAIDEYLEGAESVRALADMIASFGFIGVADEVERIQRANDLLAEARHVTDSALAVTPMRK